MSEWTRGAWWLLSVLSWVPLLLAETRPASAATISVTTTNDEADIAAVVPFVDE